MSPQSPAVWLEVALLPARVTTGVVVSSVEVLSRTSRAVVSLADPAGPLATLAERLDRLVEVLADEHGVGRLVTRLNDLLDPASPLGHALGTGGPVERLIAEDGPLGALTGPGGGVERLLSTGGALDRMLAPGGTLDRLLAPGGILDRVLTEDGFVDKLVAEGGTLDQVVALGSTLESIAPQLEQLASLVPALQESADTLHRAVGPLGTLAGRIPLRRGAVAGG